nr:hypothetical protein HK105_002786 [Polyrhizophydium stewartii]
MSSGGTPEAEDPGGPQGGGSSTAPAWPSVPVRPQPAASPEQSALQAQSAAASPPVRAAVASPWEHEQDGAADTSSLAFVGHAPAFEMQPDYAYVEPLAPEPRPAAPATVPLALWTAMPTLLSMLVEPVLGVLGAATVSEPALEPLPHAPHAAPSQPGVVSPLSPGPINTGTTDAAAAVPGGAAAADRQGLHNASAAAAAPDSYVARSASASALANSARATTPEEPPAHPASFAEKSGTLSSPLPFDYRASAASTSTAEPSQRSACRGPITTADVDAPAEVPLADDDAAIQICPAHPLPTGHQQHSPPRIPRPPPSRLHSGPPQDIVASFLSPSEADAAHRHDRTSTSLIFTSPPLTPSGSPVPFPSIGRSHRRFSSVTNESNAHVVTSISEAQVAPAPSPQRQIPLAHHRPPSRGFVRSVMLKQPQGAPDLEPGKMSAPGRRVDPSCKACGGSFEDQGHDCSHEDHACDEPDYEPLSSRVAFRHSARCRAAMSVFSTLASPTSAAAAVASSLLEQPKLALSADHDEEHECLCDDNGAAMSEDTAAADLLFELIEASAAERMSSSECEPIPCPRRRLYSLTLSACKVWGGTVVVGDLDPGFVARYELETVATRVAPRTHIGGGGQGASDEVLFGRSSRHADARDSLMLLKSQMQAMPGIAISPRNSILRYSQLLATGVLASKRASSRSSVLVRRACPIHTPNPLASAEANSKTLPPPPPTPPPVPKASPPAPPTPPLAGHARSISAPATSTPHETPLDWISTEPTAPNEPAIHLTLNLPPRSGSLDLSRVVFEAAKAVASSVDPASVPPNPPERSFNIGTPGGAGVLAASSDPILPIGGLASIGGQPNVGGASASAGRDGGAGLVRDAHQSRAVLERIGGETQEKRKSEQETQEWAGAGGLVGSGDVTLGEISQSIDVDDPNVTSDPQTQDILAGPRLLYPHAQEHLTHLDVQVLLSEAFLVLYKASRTAVSIKQCVASGTGVSSSATPLIHGQLAIQGVAVGPAASGSLGPSSHGGHSFNVGGRKMHKRTTSSASRASQQSTASSGSAHGVLRILSKQPSLDSLAEARPSLSGSQSRPSFEPALSTSRTPAVDHAHSQHGRQASPMHSSSVRASPRKVLQAIGSKVRSLFTGQGSRFRDGGSPGHNHQPQHHQNTSQHPASDQSKHDRRAVLEGLARMHACQLSMLNTTDPARLLTLHAEAIQRFHALKQTLNSVRFATVQMLKTHVTPESPGNNAANEPPDSRGQKSPPLANPRQMGKAGGAEGESDHESPSAAAAAASRRPALSDPKLRQHLSTEERLWMDMICRERTPSEFVELFFDIVVADLDVGELLEKYGSEAA